MPVDATSAHSKRRQVPRTTVSDDDLELRRARGEISCAECRRLKLKCDKQIPCSSCTRRGCPSICPNGSLSTGQGTRFVLADTNQLHTKIAEMGHRIRELEDALAIYHSAASTEPHPLLREDLLAIKFGPERRQIAAEKPISQPSLQSAMAAFGTLTVGDRGDGKYFGPSAGTETLFLAGADLEEPDQEEEVPGDALVPEIRQMIASLNGNMEASINVLFDRLPPQTRASSLCETYLEQASWAFRPIKRDEIMEDIKGPIYKALRDREAGVPITWFSPHKLSVLYLIFALGALVDLTLEPYSKEAENYYNLSRVALTLRSVFDSPEISAVQAILLTAGYHAMAGRRYTMDSSWTLVSLGSKLAQSLGLHRDCARWNFDAKTVQRRRSLFWEMFSADQLYSLALGRPPSIPISYVDCEFPADDEATLDAQGNVLVGYYRWKYEFSRDILSVVLEKTLSAKAPTYETILELDRRVRQKTLPPHLNSFMNLEDENCTPSVYMPRCLLGQYRSVALLYIHRSFFAQAMLDHPINPLRSPYAPSFLAAYRCASGVIKSSLNHYDRFPELCGRWWGVWTHLFSAAVIVASIVTRSPASSMASSAFIELGLACDLFEKGALASRRAKSGMAILQRMREKAFQVYSQFRSGNTPIPGVLSTGRPDYGEDELALFGGQTKILVSRLLSQSKRTGKKSGSTSSATSSDPSSPQSQTNVDRASSSSMDQADVHPSLVEYLSMYPPPNASPSPPRESPGDPHASQTTFGAPHVSSPESLNPNYTPSPLGSQQMASNPLPQLWPGQWTGTTSFTDTSNHQPQQSQPPFEAFSQIQSQYLQEASSYTLANQSRAMGHPPLDVPATAELQPNQTNLVDLMMLTGESGIDDEWMSFMKNSGFLEAANAFPQGSHTTNVGGMPEPSSESNPLNFLY